MINSDILFVNYYFGIISSLIFNKRINIKIILPYFLNKLNKLIILF